MVNQNKDKDTLTTPVQLDIKDILSQLGISPSKLPNDLIVALQKKENPR